MEKDNMITQASRVPFAVMKRPADLTVADRPSPGLGNYSGFKRFSTKSVTLPARISLREVTPSVQGALKGLASLPQPLRVHTFDSLEDHWTICSVDKQSYEPRKRGSNHQSLRDPGTRNVCLVGIGVGWILAILSICLGLMLVTTKASPVPRMFEYRMVAMGCMFHPFASSKDMHYTPGHRAFITSQVASKLVPLIMNFVLTAVLNSMNFVHATSLRWALWHEGRLSLKSTLRLFSASRSHVPNRWYINILGMAAIALSYGSIAVMMTSFHIKAIIGDVNMALSYYKIVSHSVPGPRYGLDFNGWGILGLGVGLLVHAVVSSWCILSKTKSILTWSSNPLSCARACVASELPFSQTTPRAPMSGSSSIVSIEKHYASTPRDRQEPMKNAVPSVRWILCATWLTFAISAIGTISIGIDASVNWKSTSASAVYASSQQLDMSSYWQNYGFIAILYSRTAQKLNWLSLVIQSCVQAVPSIGLHCVELVVQLTRDENIWRKASSRKGAELSADGILHTLTDWFCWPIISLFTFSSVIQYLFASAFPAADGIIQMSLLPAVTLSIATLLLALFAEYLARRKPVGPQPATYGSIAALAGHVDTWADTIWFGDKGEEGGIRIAGTVTDVHEVHAIRMDKMYFGLQSGIR